MFSLPRDTVDVPIPPGPARNAFGPLYSAQDQRLVATDPPPLGPLPGQREDARLQRAQGDPRRPLRPRHQVLRRGQLRRLQEGRRRASAASPSTSRSRSPTTASRSTEGRLRRVYIPSGIQHMDGAEALRYARSRHGSNDFDRGARQQRVLLSLREQADPQALIPHLPDLVNALKSAVSTDIPVNQLAPLLGLASQVDTQEHPLVRLRAAVLPDAIPEQPARLHHRAERRRRSGPRSRTRSRPTRPTRPSARRSPSEGAGVWVLNGTSDRDRGTRLAGYLDYHGLAASAPRQKPPGSGPGRHDDRRLQRRRDGVPGDDRLPRADVRGEGRRRDRSGHRGRTSSSPSATRRPQRPTSTAPPPRAG